MPPFETILDAESHAATLAHELTHRTRHPSRLDRELGRKKWGDEGNAMDEPVAKEATSLAPNAELENTA